MNPLAKADRDRLRSIKEATGKVRRWEDEAHLSDMDAGVRFVVPPLRDGPGPDLSDVVAMRLDRAPHLLAIWEPIRTKAPSPARSSPHCCYLRTVIFYHRPYVTGWARGGRDMAGVFHPDWNKGLLEYDQVETRLAGGDVVEFDGERFEVGSGHVRWHRKRWWVRLWARRTAEVRSIAA